MNISEFASTMHNFCLHFPSSFGLWNFGLFVACIHKREHFELALKNPGSFRKSNVYTGLSVLLEEGLLCNKTGQFAFL